ncbi:MAG: hypothetical protein PHU66_02805 [Bacteroidaceae bacterium]|jgi:uncharacterized lipoprotein NlpE involved in copper resistance|nr:hypothetical protein [Bacteroidaceae bacterium]
MKKLVLVLVAVAAMSFASCGNKAAQSAPAADSDSVAAVSDSDSVAADSDSTAAAATQAAPATQAPAAE